MEIVKVALDLGWTTKAQNRETVVRNNLRKMENRAEVARDQHGNYYLPEARLTQASDGSSLPTLLSQSG